MLSHTLSGMLALHTHTYSYTAVYRVMHTIYYSIAYMYTIYTICELRVTQFLALHTHYSTLSHDILRET